MSRIGKIPVQIPAGVEVKIIDQNVCVKGPNGELNKDFSPLVSITEADNTVVVKPVVSTRAALSNYGTARSIIERESSIHISNVKPAEVGKK